MPRLALLLLLGILAGCSTPEPPPRPDTAALARPAAEAVDARVAEAEARLGQTEAGQRVWAAIEAHGGLTRWYANGPMRFRYAYQRLPGGGAIDTEQLIDPWSSRARHATMPDSAAQFGWTGTEAWMMPADAELATNARFWSLTPYYFVAMPFVLADPGVNHELAGQMTFEGRTYDLVYITFDDGTGDAPDDYYYLLLDPETNQVGGVRYVVSYPGFYADGETSAERLMIYDGAQTVDGITLQEGFRSWPWTDEGAGDPSAEGTLTELAFLADTPDSAFDLPDGAIVQEQL